jgi:hypothetical protein
MDKVKQEGSTHPQKPLGIKNYGSISPYEQHWRFAQWVFSQQDRFLAVLQEGDGNRQPVWNSPMRDENEKALKLSWGNDLQ